MARPHPASYRGCSHAKQELPYRKNLRATTPGPADLDVLEIHYTRSIIRCSSSQLRSAATIATNTAAVFRKYHASGHHQVSGQSVQAKNVNIHATGDTFLAFIMVQNIVTKPSGAARERKGFSHN
jgi:hypothetical protein